MDLIECSTCHRMFNNTDGTQVCPNGHENAWSEEDRDFIPAEQVRG